MPLVNIRVGFSSLGSILKSDPRVFLCSNERNKYALKATKSVRVHFQQEMTPLKPINVPTIGKLKVPISVCKGYFSPYLPKNISFANWWTLAKKQRVSFETDNIHRKRCWRMFVLCVALVTLQKSGETLRCNIRRAELGAWCSQTPWSCFAKVAGEFNRFWLRLPKMDNSELDGVFACREFTLFYLL